MHGKNPAYRADIDALRAVAVLMVVFYHAGIDFLGGGFIGVDVFFVISGFLITGILQRNILSGNFSLIRFYENRIRRIMPALFVICIAVMCAGWYIYAVPYDFKFLQRSIKRTILACSNFYFYFNTGYFDTPAVSQPMLHTWSLGVEEQFYILYPIILSIIYKVSKQKTPLMLLGLFLASFIFSAIFIYSEQKFTFYMLPTRAWELLLGGLLATYQWTPDSQRNKNICVALGLLLICGSAAAYNTIIFTPFPGIYALPPCIGTFLYIAGGNSLSLDGPLARLVQHRFLVFIGLISYSFYLWHWPVYVLYKKAFFVTQLSAVEIASLTLVSALLAALSWRFVENPVRRKALFQRRSILYPVALTAFVSVLTLTSVIRKPFIPEEGMTYINSVKDDTPISGSMIIGKQNTPVSFAVIGDSHASAMGSFFSIMADANGLSGRMLSQNIPLMNLTRLCDNLTYMEEETDWCNAIASEAPTTVFIVVRWSLNLLGPLPHEGGNAKQIRDNLEYAFNGQVEHGEQALLASLRQTLEKLRELDVGLVYVLLPIPEQEYFVPGVAAAMTKTLKKEDINRHLAISFVKYTERNSAAIAALKTAAAEYPFVTLLDPAPLLCAGESGLCNALEGERSLYLDDDHLSTFGAMKLRPLFEPIFADLASKKQ